MLQHTGPQRKAGACPSVPISFGRRVSPSFHNPNDRYVEEWEIDAGRLCNWPAPKEVVSTNNNELIDQPPRLRRGFAEDAGGPDDGQDQQDGGDAKGQADRLVAQVAHHQRASGVYRV